MKAFGILLMVMFVAFSWAWGLSVLFGGPPKSCPCGESCPCRFGKRAMPEVRE